MVDKQVEEQISQAARRLVEYYAWEWLTQERLTARALGRLDAEQPPPVTPLDVDRLCERASGEELHAACAPSLQDGGRWPDQAGAYRDLGNYLTRLSHSLPPPVGGLEWADIVQDTLVTVYQKHPQCKDPTSFLAWCATILRRKSAEVGRKRGREQTGPPGATGSGTPPAASPTASDQSANPLGDQALLLALRDCLDTDEERTLALCYFFGLKRRELAMVFKKPLQYWDELRRKVQPKLRTCGPLLDLLEGPPLAL